MRISTTTESAKRRVRIDVDVTLRVGFTGLASHSLNGQYAADVQGSCGAVFRPNHRPTPGKAAAGIDESNVISITAQEIVDYH